MCISEKKINFWILLAHTHQLLCAAQHRLQQASERTERSELNARQAFQAVDGAVASRRRRWQAATRRGVVRVTQSICQQTPPLLLPRYHSTAAPRHSSRSCRVVPHRPGQRTAYRRASYPHSLLFCLVMIREYRYRLSGSQYSIGDGLPPPSPPLTPSLHRLRSSRPRNCFFRHSPFALPGAARRAALPLR